MRKILLLLCVTASLFAESEFAHELSFLVGDSENGRYQKADRSLAYALEYQYNGLDFPIKPELEMVYSQDILIYYTSEHTKYLSLMANGIYELPYTEMVTPYLKGGLGYISYSDLPNSPQSSFLVDAGGGIKLHLSEKLALKLEFTYTQQSHDDNILVLGGLSYSFGRKGVAAPVKDQIEPMPESNVKPQEETLQAEPVETQQELSANEPQITNELLAADEPQTIKDPETADELLLHNEPAAMAKTLPVFEVPQPPCLAFNINSARLTEASKESLASYAEALNRDENRQSRLLIVGHTDSDGTRASNATLSLKRAVAVRTELIADGIDPNRIAIDGMGETKPVATNSTANGREQNRRVTIIVTPDQQNSLNAENSPSDTTQE